MNVEPADSNLLIAMTVPNHVHHGTAHSWLAQHQGAVATCPITQGALLRLLIREGRSVDTALTALEAISQQPNRLASAVRRGVLHLERHRTQRR